VKGTALDTVRQAEAAQDLPAPPPVLTLASSMPHVVEFYEDGSAALYVDVGRDPVLEPHLRSSHVRCCRTRTIPPVVD